MAQKKKRAANKKTNKQGLRKALTPTQACAILEWMSENYSLDNLGTDKEKHETPEGKFAGLVYRMAHIARRPSCLHVHEAWIKEGHELYSYLKKEGLV